MKRSIKRDPFAFSLRGMSTMAPAMGPIAVSDRAFSKPPCPIVVEENPCATPVPIAIGVSTAVPTR